MPTRLPTFTDAQVLRMMELHVAYCGHTGTVSRPALWFIVNIHVFKQTYPNLEELLDAYQFIAWLELLDHVVYCPRPLT
jgi:hypothetical protein